MGEAVIKQFMWLRNQVVFAAEILGREENLVPVLVPTLSDNVDVHPKLAHKGVEIVYRANRKICETLLRYNVEKPESPYARVKKKVTWFSQYPMTVLSGVSSLDQIQLSNCKRSRPRRRNKLPKTSSGSLELIVVSKTRVCEQPSGASSK